MFRAATCFQYSYWPDYSAIFSTGNRHSL